MRHIWWIILCSCIAGCSAFPDVTHQPRYHNPFPQLTRVAVLPFFNQSADPTVDQDKIALAYYNELQAIPGFEVVPVGVTKTRLMAYLAEFQLQQAPPASIEDKSDSAVESADGGKLQPAKVEPRTPEDFQRLAQWMDVDAIVVGSVTEYSAYYPPRLGLSVRWYAANPSFHPIPPGYGLPWGTPEEEYIPSDLVFAAEFALAQEQLKTQTPEYTRSDGKPDASKTADAVVPAGVNETVNETGGIPPPLQSSPAEQAERPVEEIIASPSRVAAPHVHDAITGDSSLPPDWPDPRGFVPPPPSAIRPKPRPQSEPVMTHTRLFHGNDSEFTERLANYYYFRDDARFGDWQGYLQRTDDFIRFCCHLHITEMLSARGGAGESRLVFRWPIRRYER